MADRVGQQLGNYRLIRLLGRGGFAEVYLGEHLRLGTQAAVKVLHTRLASHDDVEGFEKEARMVGHLKHPHIVRVLDYDVEKDTPFLVMDYAVGSTLRHRHPKGTRLPLTTIISYAKQVAGALQYAHDQLVIHRDIKPENMLVGEQDELLLSDFGIAIVAQSSRYQSTQQMGGTMAYIAPEQIQGHPRSVSDQYSLGIVVYEWLCGSCPFHGSMTEIVAQHLAASPPSLCEKVPTISPDVEQVVLTALEKNPHRRFKSVRAFATALEQARQKTEASPVVPMAPLQYSVSAAQSGEQTLPAELPIAKITSSPIQPALQPPTSSLSLIPSSTETPSNLSSFSGAIPPPVDLGRLASLPAPPIERKPSVPALSRHFSKGRVAMVIGLLLLVIGSTSLLYMVRTPYKLDLQVTATTSAKATNTALSQAGATATIEAGSTATTQALATAEQGIFSSSPTFYDPLRVNTRGNKWCNGWDTSEWAFTGGALHREGRPPGAWLVEES